MILCDGKDIDLLKYLKGFFKLIKGLNTYVDFGEDSWVVGGICQGSVSSGR